MSLNKIIADNYDALRKQAGKITRNKVAADDLLHTVLEAIMTSPAASELCERSPDKVPVYICQAMRISYFSQKSRYHLQQVRPGRMVQPTDEQIPEPEPCDISARVLNEQADIYISMLPEIDAMLIRMYVIPGFSYSHLSQVTGLKKSYLYNRVQGAIKQLQNHAQNKGVAKSGRREKENL